MSSLLNRLNTEVDNSPLILFRILFGALMFCEGIGAMATGWLQATFVDVQFTFNFIGLMTAMQVYTQFIGCFGYQATSCLRCCVLEWLSTEFVFAVIYAASHSLPEHSELNGHRVSGTH